MGSSNLLEPILLQLGASPDAVAAHLRAHRVKGVRNTARFLNPIVRFVQAQLRLDDYRLDITHGDGLETYTLRITLPNGAEQPTPCPNAVKEFLDAFNDGAYPDLELR